MNHQGPPAAESAGTLALFPSEAAWARTRVLDAQAIETSDFDLDAFARYRCIRILTYSSSVQMLHTVLERFAESRVECVLGYSRVVNNVASIIALQTAAVEEVHSALRGLPASSRDDILKRVQEGRLRVRVVEGHVSHAKIFLLSDGPDGGSVRADRLGELLDLRRCSAISTRCSSAFAMTAPRSTSSASTWTFATTPRPTSRSRSSSSNGSIRTVDCRPMPRRSSPPGVARR